MRKIPKPLMSEAELKNIICNEYTKYQGRDIKITGGHSELTIIWEF